MPSHLGEIFKDNTLTDKIKKRLPHLFHLAELESSRAGKIGMEEGTDVIEIHWHRTRIDYAPFKR